MTENTTAETIANYADGSGSYTFTREGDVLTSIYDGFRYAQTLHRAPEFDNDADVDDYRLTDRFASDQDRGQRDGVVWIDGLAYEVADHIVGTVEFTIGDVVYTTTIQTEHGSADAVEFTAPDGSALYLIAPIRHT